MSPTRKLLTYSLYVLGLAYVGYLLREAWPQLSQLQNNFSLAWLVVSTLGFLFHTMLVCVMLNQLFRAAGVDLDMRSTGRIFYLSQMTKYVPGVVWWFAMQASLLESENAVRKVVIANIRMMLLVSATFILFSLSLLCLLLPSLSPAWLLLWLPLSVLAVYLLEGLQSVRYLPAYLRRLIPQAIVEEVRPTAGGMPVLYMNCLLQFVLYIITASSMVLAFYDMGMVELATLAAYQCLAWVAGVMSVVVPAGMGVREGVFMLLASVAQQFPAEQLQSLAVINRSVQIGQELLLSVAAVILVRIRLL